MDKTPVSTESLLAALQEHADLPVRFLLGEQSIAPGYHLTEVKFACVKSLDCGQAYSQWDELIIQLLDGHAESKRGFMKADRFLNILKKAGAGNDGGAAGVNAQLFFELAPQNAGLQKVNAKSLHAVDGYLVIQLDVLSPQCKAFKRALARP